MGGSYTAAAAVSGLLGALFLDRFDRKRALAVALLGLVVGTAAGGLAQSFASLLAARVVAGLFGGPATSLALSIVADTVPPERRGRALAIVMAAFSAATVLGVPLALELARLGGWRLPFFAVAALGLVAAGTVAALMQPLRGHLQGEHHITPIGQLLGRPSVILALWANVSVMMAIFSVVPNMSAFVQFNLGYPRERLGTLYLAGGVASLATVAAVGRMVDRFGSLRVGSLGTGLLIAVTLVFFVLPVGGLSPMLLMIGFMIAGSLRGISMNALVSRVPEPDERARYMSLQSSVQHIASAAGAFVAARMLTEQPDGRLVGMPRVAMLLVIVSLAFPVLVWAVERELGRAAAAPAIAKQPLPLAAPVQSGGGLAGAAPESAAARPDRITPA